MVRRQYSGNEHRVNKGIGVVNCVYVNLDTQEFWVIDWRINNPDEFWQNQTGPYAGDVRQRPPSQKAPL
jgi:hypothetical protein